MTNKSVNPDSEPGFVEVSQLRIGMFVELELGWMAHPFPTGSFKISSEKQIEVMIGEPSGRAFDDSSIWPFTSNLPSSCGGWLPVCTTNPEASSTAIATA